MWCDEKGAKKVAYHPLSHLEINEKDGLKKLHQIKSILLADKSRVIELDDVLKMEEGIACMLLELPQREIGGNSTINLGDIVFTLFSLGFMEDGSIEIENFINDADFLYDESELKTLFKDFSD